MPIYRCQCTIYDDSAEPRPAHLEPMGGGRLFCTKCKQSIVPAESGSPLLPLSPLSPMSTLPPPVSSPVVTSPDEMTAQRGGLRRTFSPGPRGGYTCTTCGGVGAGWHFLQATSRHFLTPVMAAQRRGGLGGAFGGGTDHTMFNPANIPAFIARAQANPNIPIQIGPSDPLLASGQSVTWTWKSSIVAGGQVSGQWVPSTAPPRGVELLYCGSCRRTYYRVL